VVYGPFSSSVLFREFDFEFGVVVDGSRATLGDEAESRLAVSGLRIEFASVESNAVSFCRFPAMAAERAVIRSVATTLPCMMRERISLAPTDFPLICIAPKPDALQKNLLPCKRPCKRYSFDGEEMSGKVIVTKLHGDATSIADELRLLERELDFLDAVDFIDLQLSFDHIGL
jgi:hypothetical protein